MSMEFFFWAVREGKEDDARNALEDPGLLAINALIKPIWGQGIQEHAAFVQQAVTLLQGGFPTVIEHAPVTWYGLEHQDTCEMESVCYRHSQITIQDGSPTPIKAQVDSKTLLENA